MIKTNANINEIGCSSALKAGKMVHLHFGFTTTNTIPVNQTLFTVPTGYRIGVVWSNVAFEAVSGGVTTFIFFK